jgi:CheY-like chemotaxis protein
MSTLRVLHVEDEPDIREIVEISLGLDSDFVTRSCASGHEALVVAAEWPPDIILMDVMMPGMDGPSTLARLRGNAGTAAIPVVFMTARAQSRELNLFRSLGAAGVIPKPFDPMTLAASVRSYVRPADGWLNSMRNVFLKRLAGDAAILMKQPPALFDETTLSAALAVIRTIAHGLAGAGGIFGFPAIGDAAAELEEAAIAKLDGAGSVEEIACALDHLLGCIEKSSARREVRPHARLDA